MTDIFEKQMIIFNQDKEIRVPVTEYQYNLIKEFLGTSPCLRNCYVFADEETLIQELDEAVKNKLF